MKTEITKIIGSWEDVVNDCRTSISKGELGHEPSEKFKRGMMICEHSPIRDIWVKFKWVNIPYWIAMHFKTHIWPAVCSTQRNDRQDNYDRSKAPQDSPVIFSGEMNAQHCIDTARKRLCYQASPETREYMEDLKISIHKFLPEVSDAMVPNCVYRGGCPEMSGCPFIKTHHMSYYDYLNNQTFGGIQTSDIQERYRMYNTIFWDDNNQITHWDNADDYSR